MHRQTRTHSLSRHALLALPLALSALALSALAQTQTPPGTQNPYDVEQQRLAEQTLRGGRSPRGILPLLELWSHMDRATPKRAVAALERLSKSRRLSPSRQAYATWLLAKARARAGNIGDARSLIDDLGFVRSFRVMGPFDNEGKQGFERALAAEEKQGEAFDPRQSAMGKERMVSWRVYPDVSNIGYVDFDAIFRPRAHTCALAQTSVHSDSAQPLSLWAGAGGAMKIWWNGAEVLRDEAYRGPDPERSAVRVQAQIGPNRLLVKVCAAEGPWGFFLRVAKSDGHPASNVQWDAQKIAAAPHATETAATHKTISTTFDQLVAATERKRASVGAREDLARFLKWTKADDPAEEQAADLAAQAAKQTPSTQRWVLAAQLAKSRGDKMRYAEQAHQRAPKDARVILLRAALRQSGVNPLDALPILDKLPRGTMEAMQGALLRAQILQELEMPESALRVLDDVHAKSPGWLSARAEALEATGARDRAMKLREEALRARHNLLRARRVVIFDAVRRGEARRATNHLQALLAAAPQSTNTFRYAARMYEALGKSDDALSAYRSARTLAPEDADTLVAEGRYLLRLNQPEAAAQSLRLALAVRPQDAETRELLEQIKPAPRPDERYAIGRRALLHRKGKSNGFSTTTLQDLTVNTVYENGLGSSFRQVAYQIHDGEGARRFRTYRIQFDPGSQRVDIRGAAVHRGSERVLEATQTFEQQLGEPWYRIYYDTRALVVVFPDLEPGDVVEVKYRIDDVAPRNLFADYYGDLRFLRDFAPVRRFDYVLITPKSRKFFFNQPRLKQLKKTVRERKRTRVYHYFARNIPAIRAEPGMPGLTEVAPYLHISTYRTWQDVGAWYWGLVRDQLKAHGDLKNTVASLVRDKSDVRAKVVAIHNWVVRNTRYVGLEFGIHGYKPYRVPDIVRRGFGDCKDKASLLYVMLREAGIDAHVVLVRTRRNGAIRDKPASLAVFDHAIAYVPDLDLYLDGTAEHSGTQELPQMDQGVTVLHVWPKGAELRKTPVLGPQRNARTRTLDMKLATDGSAELKVSEEVTGESASGYRNTYQAEGTRKDRFERSLRNLFPGLTLESQEFDSLDDLEAPVSYRYTARVPQVAHRDGLQLTVAPSVMGDLIRTMARVPRRRHPLDLGGRNSYQERRTVRLPTGTGGAQVPRGGKAESPFGVLQLKFESSGQEVSAVTQFELRRDRIAPDEYPAFRRWVREADELLRQRITVRAQPGSDESSSASPPEPRGKSSFSDKNAQKDSAQ